jgi:hypothetical protein
MESNPRITKFGKLTVKLFLILKRKEKRSSLPVRYDMAYSILYFSFLPVKVYMSGTGWNTYCYHQGILKGEASLYS